jgi:hypothetical protein
VRWLDTALGFLFAFDYFPRAEVNQAATIIKNTRNKKSGVEPPQSKSEKGGR